MILILIFVFLILPPLVVSFWNQPLLSRYILKGKTDVVEIYDIISGRGS